MNLNEECLLHFLKNPNGLDETLEQLKTYLFLKENKTKDTFEIIVQNV
jgi:hypothetical protein